MRVMAIDYGERYVGVAITDQEGRLAVRHSVVDQKRSEVIPQLKVIVEREGIEKILVGIPMSLSGDETDQTHICLAFMERLRETLDGIEVVGIDETLTSYEAEQRVATEQASPHDAHAEAARIMLEDYLRNPLV